MSIRATYSPEDNKLRIYPDGERIDSILDEQEYASFKSAGYKWAAKQECFVAPRWTPTAEDWALALAEEIEDEDYSPEERSADRAERFSGYREKRRGEANDRADTFEAGPQAFGHQNQARAERQARKHDRHRLHSLSQWSKAEYWQQRTAGVIRHALHKSSPAVRRGRIDNLEAEQRKHEKWREEYAETYRAWQGVARYEDSAHLLPLGEDGYVKCDELGPGQRLAYALANTYKCIKMLHPTSEEANAKAKELHGEHFKFGGYDFLVNDKYLGVPFERFTPKRLAEEYMARATKPEDMGARWSKHYELRIAYEKAMLENEGGRAGDAAMCPGGWIRGGRTRSCLTDADAGWKQIQKVNKSPATGRVTSVQVWGTTSGYTEESGYTKYETKPAIVTVDVSRLPEGCYRPPTAEEMAEFKAKQGVRKAEQKANAPTKPKLLNPTDDDAAKLQALWNIHAKSLHDKHCTYREYEPTGVASMDQAAYSARSKGSYSSFETVEVCENGRQPRRWDGNKPAVNPPVAFKVRVGYASGGGFSHQARRVIVLTDKPRSPLPLDWDRLFTEAESREEVGK